MDAEVGQELRKAFADVWEGFGDAWPPTQRWLHYAPCLCDGVRAVAACLGWKVDAVGADRFFRISFDTTSDLERLVARGLRPLTQCPWAPAPPASMSLVVPTAAARAFATRRLYLIDDLFVDTTNRLAYARTALSEAQVCMDLPLHVRLTALDPQEFHDCTRHDHRVISSSVDAVAKELGASLGVVRITAPPLRNFVPDLTRNLDEVDLFLQRMVIKMRHLVSILAHYGIVSSATQVPACVMVSRFPVCRDTLFAFNRRLAQLLHSLKPNFQGFAFCIDASDIMTLFIPTILSDHALLERILPSCVMQSPSDLVKVISESEVLHASVDGDPKTDCVYFLFSNIQRMCTMLESYCARRGILSPAFRYKLASLATSGDATTTSPTYPADTPLSC